MYAFFLLFGTGAAARMPKCVKMCDRLFYGNATLVDECAVRCRNVGDNKKANKVVLHNICDMCIDYCKVQYKYSADGRKKCEKKCASVKRI